MIFRSLIALSLAAVAIPALANYSSPHSGIPGIPEAATLICADTGTNGHACDMSNGIGHVRGDAGTSILEVLQRVKSDIRSDEHTSQ